MKTINVLCGIKKFKCVGTCDCVGVNKGRVSK